VQQILDNEHLKPSAAYDIGGGRAGSRLVARMREEVECVAEGARPPSRPVSALEREEGQAAEGDMDKYELVFSRARHGRYEDIAKLLEQGVAIDGRDRNGNTILMIAAQNGKTKVAKLAIKAKANPNSQNGQGNTALHFAMAYGFKKMAEMLLKSGADSSIRNRAGMTCYEGIDKRTKSRITAGEMGQEEGGDAPPEKVGTTVSGASATDLAVIKVQELNGVISTLKAKLADAQNDKVIEADRLQQELEAAKKQVQANAFKGGMEIEAMRSQVGVLEEQNKRAAAQIKALEAEVETTKQQLAKEKAAAQSVLKQEQKKVGDLQQQLGTASAAAMKQATDEVAGLHKQLDALRAERDEEVAKLEVEQDLMEEKNRVLQEGLDAAKAEGKALTEETERLEGELKALEEAKAAESGAAGSLEQQLTEYKGKWSAELMERKKLTQDVEVKGKRLDRAYADMEVMESNKKFLEEQLAAEKASKAATEASLSAAKSAQASAEEQAQELVVAKEALEAEKTGLLQSHAAEVEALKAKLKEAEDNAQKEFLSRCEEHNKFAESEKKLAAAMASNASAGEASERCKKLEAELATTKQQLQSAAGDAKTAQLVPQLENEVKQLQARLESQSADMEASASAEIKVAQQKLQEAQKHATAMQAEAAAAKTAGDAAVGEAATLKQELSKSQAEAESRAAMLQGCLDAERKRYGELESKLAAAQEEANAAAAMKKELQENKSELEETKAKLATLWSQFLGGK